MTLFRKLYRYLYTSCLISCYCLQNFCMNFFWQPTCKDLNDKKAEFHYWEELCNMEQIKAWKKYLHYKYVDIFFSVRLMKVAASLHHPSSRAQHTGNFELSAHTVKTLCTVTMQKKGTEGTPGSRPVNARMCVVQLSHTAISNFEKAWDIHCIHELYNCSTDNPTQPYSKVSAGHLRFAVLQCSFKRYFQTNFNIK